MEKIRTAHETSEQQQSPEATHENSRKFKDLRTLSDLEMVLVGGGDGAAGWP